MGFFKGLLVGVCVIFTTTLFGQPNKTDHLTQYVDPFIGTGFHGHVFVGASVPFGAVQLGPTNLSQGWDWCSGYHISDSTIVGFQHTHLSGTGIGDLGDISFMPATGPLKVSKGTLNNPANGYMSFFSHRNEVARPGYYRVLLDRYQILAELTATCRVGFHRYTFPESAQSHIVIDLEEGIADVPVETYIRKIADNTITGYRYSRGWARDQRIYFAAVFSKPIENFSVYDSSTGVCGEFLKGQKVKGVVGFRTAKGERILVKVGISPVSSENALLNITAEIPGWDFDAVVAAADKKWSLELQKIRIKTDSVSQLKKFYTAVYHTLIAPSVFDDVNGEYWGTDKQVHHEHGFTNLTTFSLWDTYRAANPLLTLTQPQAVNNIINSMLAIYQQQGKLPVWHLMANETNTMPGYSAVPVVADAYLKGFRGFDTMLAYEAVKHSAMRDDRGLKFVKKLGYIPADSMVESVATGLEYSIDDWCIAQMALKMGKQADYAYFLKRSKNYAHYFDPKTRFMRGRISGTAWRTPFSPFISRHMRDDFTEGNAWQYTWLVPQDVEGMIRLMGGDKAYVKKLDSLFSVQGFLGDEASGDISGLIGQYAHGNEPSHHIAYLYAYAGQPWKTARQVRFILNNFYTDKPDGIIGNEDVGQMSAWYIFSALGFYPVNPCNGKYVFGSPSVNDALITLDKGKTFEIRVHHNNEKNIYIQYITLNRKPYARSFITHADILRGGLMEIDMGDKPSPRWGVNKRDRPYSGMRGKAWSPAADPPEPDSVR